MTNYELKGALFSRCPVALEICDNGKLFYMPFNYVSAVIYRKGENCRTDITVELYHRKSHSVVIANPKHVKRLVKYYRDI